MRIIPKAENTSKHKYNQSNAINNMAKAILSKQYNQRYDQSNMTSNIVRTIKAVWLAIQSRQTQGW